MLVLALDTATPSVSAAVCDGERVLAEHDVVDARRHGELLAPAIQQVLRDAEVALREVDLIAVGVGPGPFTSLRVGVVTARTLGAATGVPVRGVCTHDAIALDAVRLDPTLATRPFVVATDARRREVYWSAYEGGARVEGPVVSRPADLGADRPVVGHGAVLYPDELGPALLPHHVRAAAVAQHVIMNRPVLEPVPLYLRRPDATEPTSPKRVLA